tara:strand:+ start:441 stop:770 length:330 start_codon:yes stop_codon:yes gene_type:complete
MALAYSFPPVTLTSLSAAGVTGSTRISGASSLTFQVTTSGIGTNVKIRLEGSLDDVNFFNLDDSEEDTTLTANGTFGYALSACPIEFVRLRLVSVSGGTPTVATKIGAL